MLTPIVEARTGEAAPCAEESLPLTIESANADARATWDGFLASHPHGSFYHLYDWKPLNEAALGHSCEYLLARSASGAVAGVLPLVMVKSRLFGRILCSMPFVNYGGPIANDPRVATALCKHAAQRASDLRADYLEVRCAAPIETDMPVSLRKVSLTVELTPDPQALLNSFSAKHRKNLRRAQKNELEVRIGGIDLLDQFYDILARSWHSLGTPLYAPSYFRRILQTFPDNTNVYVCHLRGDPVAVALTGHYNGTVEGMWAGGRPELRHLDANYVLYWEMLRDTCERGFSCFHLGRSTSDSGAEQFKAKWNAQAHQLYWYFHRPDGGVMPELNVDNPKYKLAINAWRKLPHWATRVIGPPLARLIP